MENCEYKVVGNNNDLDEDKFVWKYFIRQALVSSVAWMAYLVYGLGFGAPTVFIPQIRKENNSTAAVDESMKSWIACTFDYAAVPWSVILPISAFYLGRKLTYAFCCFAMLTSSLVLYCSSSITHILISEAIIAILAASHVSVSIMILGEYTSPKYRGIFLTFKSATLFWGIWISNFIGTFVHWKNIALVMIVCSLYAAIAIFFLPESPYYLASKSKFDECITSHRWLKGTNKISEKELRNLLSIHDSVSMKPGFLKSLLNKRFYKATLLGVCLFVTHVCSGKLACGMYALDIIKSMTSSEKTSYTGMLILDGVTVLSMYIGSALSKFLRRKLLFISSASVGILSLFLLSVHVYLVKISVLSNNKYISITLLSTYSVGIACGPMILCTTLLSEILPLVSKSTSVIVIGIIDHLLSATVMKLTPFVAAKFGLHVVFFIFGASSLILVFIIYLYLPETKDKTLLEISDEISNKRSNKCKKNNVLELKNIISKDPDEMKYK